MGKFKPYVIARVSSKETTISSNLPQPALQEGQLSALCSWLQSVFAVVYKGGYYSFLLKANPAGKTVIISDGGWGCKPLVIFREWDVFLDLQEKLGFYTSAAIKFGLQNPNATTVSVFEYAWNLLEEEL